MKHSFQGLMDFVCRANTLEKVQIAENYIRKCDYITNGEYNELMMSLAYIQRELYRGSRSGR